MEYSRTSSPGFSTARFLRHASSLHRKNILVPTKVSGVPKRHVPPPSKLYGDRNSSDLFCQPKNSFRFHLYNTRKTLPLLKATTDSSGTDKSDSSGTDKLDSCFTNMSNFFDILMRFIKPHILYGTIVAFTCMMTSTLMKSAHLVMLPKWLIFLRSSATLLAIICADGFVNGINQIYDIAIDKINKPHYPLASGELSLRSAWILVLSYTTISIAISIFLKSTPLLACVLSILVLGSLYSVPPFSTKRSTIGACLTISLMRFLYVIGLSSAARSILGLPFQLSAEVIFLAIIISLFTLASAALKDLEDLEGDVKNGVPTLAAKYGPKKVALFCFGFILHLYGGAIAAAISMPQVFKPSVMIPAHIFLALYVIFQAWKLDKANYNKEASLSMYQSIMKLYNAEYVLFACT